MNLGSILTGAAALALLDAVLSSKGASNAGGALLDAGNAVEWFLSPEVPAFSTSGSSSASTTAATTTTTPATTTAAVTQPTTTTTVPALQYSPAPGTSFD
jgi:hypothetical protein